MTCEDKCNLLFLRKYNMLNMSILSLNLKIHIFICTPYKDKINFKFSVPMYIILSIKHKFWNTWLLDPPKTWGQNSENSRRILYCSGKSRRYNESWRYKGNDTNIELNLFLHIQLLLFVFSLYSSII